MIQASLRGKIPRFEHREDVLTSNVFSALRYCTGPELLLNLIQHAVDTDGAPIPLNPVGVHKAHYHFWPRLKESEPDVLILLERTSGSADVICVEVKYHSGKSGEDDAEALHEERELSGTRDQLARQCSDMVALCRGSQRLDSVWNIDKAYVVYLTLDAAIPAKSFDASLASMPEGYSLYWLSWRSFLREIEKWTPSQDTDQPIKKDLISYLHHKGLRTEIEFTLKQPDEITWNYSSDTQILAAGLYWLLRGVSPLSYDYIGRGVIKREEYFSGCKAVHFKCPQYSR